MFIPPSAVVVPLLLQCGRLVGTRLVMSTPRFERGSYATSLESVGYMVCDVETPLLVRYHLVLQL